MSLLVDQGDDYRAVFAKGKAETRSEAIGEMTKKILVKYFGAQAGAAFSDEVERQYPENRVLVVLEPERMWTWALDDDPQDPWISERPDQEQ